MRAWASSLVILAILLSMQVSAETMQPAAPSSTATAVDAQAQLSSLLDARFAAAETNIAKKIIDNNDINVGAWDNRMKIYMKDFQQKAVLGIMGLNLLVAGIIFFFINKHSKDFNYESVNMKRKKETEDRGYIAEMLNYLKQKVDTMEADAKNRYDISMMNIKQLEEGYNRGMIHEGQYYQGEQQGGGQYGAPGVQPGNSGSGDGRGQYQWPVQDGGAQHGLPMESQDQESLQKKGKERHYQDPYQGTGQFI